MLAQLKKQKKKTLLAKEFYCTGKAEPLILKHIRMKTESRVLYVTLKGPRV